MEETTRQRKTKLLNRLRDERESFIPDWRTLADYIAPRRVRFNVSDRNRGGRKDQKIIDNTATLAERTLSSGMMGGVTSPARPWFRLATPDPALNEFASAKRWLHEVQRRMSDVFTRSNIYNALPLTYDDISTFATGSLIVVEDEKEIIRGYPQPIGSYMLANNDRLVVDTFAREFSMTVRQLVSKFGEDRVSTSVREKYRRGNFEEWVDVAHIITPNPDADPSRLAAKYKPWQSIYFEKGNSDAILSESGFDEFPVMAPRWSVTGEDVYGTSCPGMEVLGDVMALQHMHKRHAQAIDKMLNPPLVGPSSLQGKKVSLLPGDVTYIDTQSGQDGLRPVHQVQPDTRGLIESVREHQYRIKRGYFEDLFLMLSATDRREITAREVAEKHEEKMVMLGPVLGRLNDELLDPLIDRTYKIMERRGLLPPPPKELEGVKLKVEYISIMAQAQKMIATAGVERFIGFVGNMAAVQPEVLDKVDLDQTVDEYGDMIGVPPTMVRPDDEVAQIRQQRLQKQQQQEQAMMAQQAAEGAKTLSEADTSRDNALTRLLGGDA